MLKAIQFLPKLIQILGAVSQVAGLLAGVFSTAHAHMTGAVQPPGQVPPSPAPPAVESAE